MLVSRDDAFGLGGKPFRREGGQGPKTRINHDGQNRLPGQAT